MSTHNNTPEQLELPFTLTLPLTKGYSAIIDATDSDLTTLKWCVILGHKTQYATRRDNKIMPYLHRVILSRILGRELLKTEHVDHVNGNGLDNRRCNLRLATPSQSQQNQPRDRANTSGYKGVTLCKATLRWKAQIQVNKKHMHLGYFTTPELAYAAYCEAAKELHGEFARLD